MVRQHQFYKVELVSIIEPQNCNLELDRMLSCAKNTERLEILFKLYTIYWRYGF